MRRVLFSLVGATATTTALIGGKCFLAPSGTTDAAAQVAPSSKAPSTGAAKPKVTTNGSASKTPTPGQLPQARPTPKPKPTTKPAPPGPNNPGQHPGGTTPPNSNAPSSGKPSTSGSVAPSSPSSSASTPPSVQPSSSSSDQPSTSPSAPETCESFDGDTVPIFEDDDQQNLLMVTITVCDHRVTEAGAGIMFPTDDFIAENDAAIATLNSLVPQYYQTDPSQIAYTGATYTAAAYRASLQSALAQIGL